MTPRGFGKVSLFNRSAGGDHAAMSVSNPLARTEALIVEDVADEVLVYDERASEAHCLGPAAAQVWRACDGQTDREQLAAGLDLDGHTVERALDELEACGLLEGPMNPGVTRRQAAERFAKVGAAVAAAPLIYSIASPMPAAAQTLTALCQAVNSVAGHDCGTQVANPVGCKSIPGCCCCHNFTQAPLTTICSGDPQHCCTSATGCTAAGGNTCS